MVFVTAERAKRFLWSGAESEDTPQPLVQSTLVRTNQSQIVLDSTTLSRNGEQPVATSAPAI
jgi:hypothetical protein